MDVNVSKLIELVNCSLYSKRFTGASHSELMYIYDISCKNSISELCFNGLKGYSSDNDDVNSFIDYWKTAALRNTITQLRKEKELEKVISLFKENGIKYALFKGIILSILYPAKGIRYSSDSDIWVAEETFDKADRLLQEMDFARDEDSSKECVYNYRNPFLYIEMHKFLWEDYTGKKIEEIKKLKWTDSSSFVKVKVGNSSYDALGYTEHLEFMFFHTIKHYVYKGFGIRHLIDLVVYINKHIDNIDVEKFWDDMRAVGYEKFCITALATCVEYLEMDSSILSGKSVPNVEFLERFILAAIDSGTFGDPLVRVTKLDGFYDEKADGGKGIRTIFPPYLEMKTRYAFVAKCKLLLPLAWLMRIVGFIWNPQLIRDKKQHLKNDELRQDLMKELELM